jgi:putative transposase
MTIPSATFFAFPADHWDHLRTTSPIESVFATARHRTVQNWFPKVIQGVKFQDGIEVAPEAKSIPQNWP